MQILFTRNELPLSWLIRHLTREPVSHCALRFPTCVLHMNLEGLQITDYASFSRAQEIVYSIEMPEKISALQTIMMNVHKHYDFGALLYLGLRAILPFLPKANLWQNTGMFLCTEFVTEYLNDEEDSLITPYQLYLQLSKGE